MQDLYSFVNYVNSREVPVLPAIFLFKFIQKLSFKCEIDKISLRVKKSSLTGAKIITVLMVRAFERSYELCFRLTLCSFYFLFFGLVGRFDSRFL